MTTSKQNTLPTQSSLLPTLRNLGREPATSISEMRRIAEAQAAVLHEALLGPVHQLPAYASRMFPTIAVERVISLPVAGLSYWTGQAWHIDVRKEDSSEEQTFTMLYQLKRIIDHPLHHPGSEFTAEDWDALANHFAKQALLLSSVKVTP